MANGWTPERRAKQAERIKAWAPWKKSTGPQTDEGKATAAQNAFKGSPWRELREMRRQLHKLLRDQREALQRVGRQ